MKINPFAVSRLFRSHLFRRHVGNGVDPGAGTCEMRRAGTFAGISDGCDFTGLRTGHGQFGQPEIQNLRVAALGDKNVGGFDVATDDTFGEQASQRTGWITSQLSNAESEKYVSVRPEGCSA